MKIKTLFFRLLVGSFGLGVVITTFLCLKPVQIADLVSRSHPLSTYQESLERIKTLENSDSANVDPAGRTILMGHGKKVEHAIVLFHGFTNSPRQFADLGKKFYDLGYNVFIPRVPYHGLEGDFPTDLVKLKAEDLSAVSDKAVDIAQGLGDHVSVVGLSMGGVMAGWVAQMRTDVDQAVLITPNFGTYKVPNFFLKPSINFLTLERDLFIWWDAQQKSHMPRPQTAYFGFSTRALGEIRRLGYAVQIFAQRHLPKTRSIVVVTNANDQVVSAQGIAAVVNQWQKRDVVKVKVFEFPKDLQLGHDIIDPQQTHQNIAVVYPQLISLITQNERVQ